MNKNSISFFDLRGSSVSVAKEAFKSLTQEPRLLIFDVPPQFSSREEVRQILGRLFMANCQEITIETSPGGKPYWLQKSEELDFSLSHTRRLWALGLARRASHPKIGVDLEEWDQNRDFLRLAQRFFSSTETQILEKNSGEQQKRLFLKMWTAKEALVKAEGVGLKNQMNKIEIDPFQNQILKLPPEMGPVLNWNLYFFELENGIVAFATKNSI